MKQRNPQAMINMKERLRDGARRVRQLLITGVLLVCALLLAGARQQAAASGHLDSSFNPLVTSAGVAVNAMAVQSDGKILIGGGFASVGSVARIRIARLNTNGSVDLTFNPGDGANSTVNAVAVQADGKILIGGSFTTVNNTPHNRIARLNADGSVDLTFDPGTGASDHVKAIAVQSDGKILIIGGFVGVNDTPRRFIARLNADGSLDATFDPGSGADGNVNAIAVQADGKILIGGFFTSVNGTPRNRIARLNGDGTLDATFNPSTGANGNVNAIAVQSDGKIFIGGFFDFVNGVARSCIARLNVDGSVDLTFSPGSAATEAVNAVALQADGKIFIGGNFITGNIIARLNTDGSVDTTFNPGTGGGASSTVKAIAVQSDGKILIGGFFNSVNGTPRSCIARLNADGSVDATFNPGGGASSSVLAIAVQADGKILIGGSFTTVNGLQRNRIARLNANGSLDTTFNIAAGGISAVNAIAVQSDGKILIGGSSTAINNIPHLGLARLLGFSTALADFDSDAKADISIWNPTSHNWYITNSTTGTTRVHLDWGAGSLGDIAVPADYDGDGKTDIAVWRPSEGNFYVISSQTNAPSLRNWGGGSDIPVPADYDGDGKADFAVYRPSEGNWYIINSQTNTVRVKGWGTTGDKPMPRDYDGDGRADICVFRPSEGNWYVINSATNTVTVQGWGTSTDKLVPADYDGDGKADFAVWRESEGNWYVRRSTGGVTVKGWGNTGDMPVPADYDGDGKADIAIWRPSEGTWYIIQSSTNTVRTAFLGTSGDVPAPSTVVR